jgi:hypothetical protein
MATRLLFGAPSVAAFNRPGPEQTAVIQLAATTLEAIHDSMSDRRNRTQRAEKRTTGIRFCEIQW